MSAAEGVEGRSVSGETEDDGFGVGLLDILGLLLVVAHLVDEHW